MTSRSLLRFVTAATLVVLIGLPPSASAHARKSTHQIWSGTPAHPLWTAKEQLRGAEITPAWFELSNRMIVKELNAERRLGGTITRAQMPWPIVQPAGPKDDPAVIAKIRFLLKQAKQRRIRIVGVLSGTACWDASDPLETNPCYPGWMSGTEGGQPPENPADFAAFAAGLAHRFSSDLYAEEIWNEPNAPQYFTGTPADYTQLMQATYPAVKKVDRKMIVVAGVLALGDAQWLQQAYDAGLAGNYDAISVHPYSVTLGSSLRWDNPRVIGADTSAANSFLPSVNAIHQVMLANGDSTHPIWLTEFGFPTCPSWFGACVPAAKQAAWDAESFRLAASWGYVSVAIAYKLIDNNSGDGFGVLRSNFKPKPSFAAVRRTFASLAGSKSRG